MVGWVRLERFGQLADAHLAALMGPDQGYQPQPHRVAERLEHLRQPRGRGLADRLADQRYGARLGTGPGPVRDEIEGPPACLYRHSLS